MASLGRGAAFVSTRRLLLALVVGCAVFGAQAQDRFITVASTTEPEDSGLYGYMLPMFEKKTGIKVRVLTLGTGRALDAARRGEADVVFAHAKAEEEKFVAEGQGVKRMPVMYSDFVLVGPKSDPASVGGMKDILEAFKQIQQTQALFISRSDRSGTHLAELELWKAAGINIDRRKGPWYRETGQGMGPALFTASWMNAYILADRATWTALKNRGDLTILVEDEKRLLNQYSVILVNPAKHSNVKNELGQTFVDWVISPEAQKAIADYKLDGKQLFFPNANQPSV